MDSCDNISTAEAERNSEPKTNQLFVQFFEEKKNYPLFVSKLASKRLELDSESESGKQIEPDL